MTRQDRIIALIRTVVPGVVGVLLAFVIAHVPVVATFIAWLDGLLALFGFAGVSVSVILQTLFVGVAIGAYYWIARWIGSKHPAAEKWLLGRSSVPSYAKTVTIPVHATVTPAGIVVTNSSGTTIGVLPSPITPTSTAGQPTKYGS